MSQHTQWHMANMGNDTQGLVIDEKGDNIAVVYNVRNTPLISAAPDLLEACEKAIEQVDKPWLIDILGQAIAKAKGKA